MNNLERKPEPEHEPRVFPEPRVFVAQPVYLNAIPAAILGATAYASRIPNRTIYKCCESPFHCANFNSLWCVAYNCRKKFGLTDYAMLHQDVQPERWWVDKGLEIRQRERVDLLSVALPIKDDHGLTSTAVLNTRTLATRRLTMTEIVRYLPPTFTSADLPKLGYKEHVLLHGSGMWLCDFTKEVNGQPWMEQVWFEAPSRILPLADGTLMSAVWDEGWNFSVQMYNLGMTLAVTREIKANHLGGGVWGNEEEWGEWETDGGDTSQEWILGRTG